MIPIIVWFRQDLRLHDNPALFSAAHQGLIIPIYIFDTALSKNWPMGEAQHWWLHYSLKALDQQLKKNGGKLILRKGDPKKILPQIVKKTKAKAIYWNRCYEPFYISKDNKIKELFEKNNITVKAFESTLLFSPEIIKNKQGQPFKVFSAFWRACLNMPSITTPLAKPKMRFYKNKIKTDQLNSWKLLPTKPNWAKAFAIFWSPGEVSAQRQLKKFLLYKLPNYEKHRDRPDLDTTSLLSPHLHFGEITSRQVFHVTKSLPHANKFLSELGWREFCYYILFHFPQLPDKPYRKQFNKLPWKYNHNFLNAWQKGQTGFPIIDAGMRQLWQIGWMHNRVRMLVASFLIKDLAIHWLAGEKWFWNTLVDADLANNSANWQWVAGSGVDAQPFFRIFNPILQGKKYDPQGNYIKQWIPELNALPNKYLHKPWCAPEKILKQADIILGKTYPYPMINHNKAREKALKFYQKHLKNR